MGVTAARYADRSVNARLLAALVGVERWCRRAGVDDPDLRRTLDLLWGFPTVVPATFASWHAAFVADPLLVGLREVADGGASAVVARVAAAAGAAGHSPAPVLSGTLMTSEIVGDNLFRAVDDARTLTHLHALEALLARDGVDLPHASAFPDQPATDFHGWGLPADAAAISRWRGLV